MHHVFPGGDRGSKVNYSRIRNISKGLFVVSLSLPSHEPLKKTSGIF